MPKYTLSTVIQKAIYPAVCDREAMLDADPGRRKEIQQEIDDIEALRGVAFAGMSHNQKHAAMMALTYAEQWQSSLADSLGKKYRYGREALRLSEIFREHRHTHYGKNELEAFLDAGEDYTLCGDGKFRNKDGKELEFQEFPPIPTS